MSNIFPKPLIPWVWSEAKGPYISNRLLWCDPETTGQQIFITFVMKKGWLPNRNLSCDFCRGWGLPPSTPLSGPRMLHSAPQGWGWSSPGWKGPPGAERALGPLALSFPIGPINTWYCFHRWEWETSGEMVGTLISLLSLYPGYRGLTDAAWGKFFPFLSTDESETRASTVADKHETQEEVEYCHLLSDCFKYKCANRPAFKKEKLYSDGV